MSSIVPIKKIVFAPYVKNWCRIPYGEYRLKSGEIRYTNPNGCEMYGTRPTCPPQAEFFGDIVNLTGYSRWETPFSPDTHIYELMEEHAPTMFLVIREFDLSSHMEKMKDAHPDWTEKQLANTRLWQRKFDRELADDTINFIKTNRLIDVINLVRPEAHGVNLFATCAFNRVILKRKYPLEKVRKMRLVARAKLSARSWFA